MEVIFLIMQLMDRYREQKKDLHCQSGFTTLPLVLL
jgi:hypothetical protein